MDLAEIRRDLEAAWDDAIRAHKAQHDECFVLGEGPCVPVRCSCGERFGPTMEAFMADLAKEGIR